MRTAKHDWSLCGDEIVDLYVNHSLSVREIIPIIGERHGITYHSGTLTNMMGRRGVLRSRSEAYKLTMRKTKRTCEICGKEIVASSYNQRWCEECTGCSKYKRRVTSHGIPAIVIDRTFEQQGRRCAICGKQFDSMDGTHTRKSLFIDHDHATNQFRGLLCVRCNNGLCYLDDETWFESAQRYLIAARDCPDPIFTHPPRARRYVRGAPIDVSPGSQG